MPKLGYTTDYVEQVHGIEGFTASTPGSLEVAQAVATIREVREAAWEGREPRKIEDQGEVIDMFMQEAREWATRQPTSDDITGG